MPLPLQPAFVTVADLSPVAGQLVAQAELDWGALAPILFFILYGLFQLLGRFGKNSDAGDATGEQPDEPFAERPERAPQSQEEAEARERQRKIREEIQRKIAERRASAETARQAPQPVPEPEPAPVTERPARRMRPAMPQAQPTRPQAQEPVPAGDGWASELERRLAEQRRAVEAARAQRAAAQERARDVTRQAQGARNGQALAQRQTSSRPARVGRVTATSLATQFDDPAQLRQAFVLREVLGPPLGLKAGDDPYRR